MITADFIDYPVDHTIANVERAADCVEVIWSDGHLSQFHHLWLRDNCPCEVCVNPATREQQFEIVSVPEDIHPTDVVTRNDGVEITWSHEHHISRYHAGWLRAHCYCERELQSKAADVATWDASLYGEVPSFAYEDVMTSDAHLHAWLVALRDVGLTFLHRVPVDADQICKVARSIAFARETNFGTFWNVRAELDSNSNAFTAFELPFHCDLPTRESIPGLQFLHCLTNEAEGGDSLFVDGFRIAEVLRQEDREAFDILCRLPVEFRNTDRETDYRYATPMIGLDDSGGLREIRLGNFLRGPYRVPAEQMLPLYRAYRRFVEMTRESRFQVTHSLAPGDLVGFDNRRILHARTAFDTMTGHRHLRGCYLDRDELLSRIRILERDLPATAAQDERQAPNH